MAPALTHPKTQEQNDLAGKCDVLQKFIEFNSSYPTDYKRCNTY